MTYTGRYQIPIGPLLTITAADNHLLASSENERVDLYPETSVRYFGTVGLEVLFSKNGNGQVEMTLGHLHIKRQWFRSR
jgi:hypothetical protein